MKHWPFLLVLIAAALGTFNPIHEFFHIVGFFLETGKIGEIHWSYCHIPGGGDFSYVAGAVGEGVLCGLLFIFGNRWLKYYGLSVILLMMVFWYGSRDYSRIANIYVDDMPIMICVCALAIGIVKLVKEADNGQRRTNPVYR